MATEKTVDSWMFELEPGLRTVARTLRKLILMAAPNLSESIKWGNPYYERGGRVCYLASTDKYVSLGFFNGAGLSDPAGRIEGTGKKMRHVKVRSLEGIEAEQFMAWVREAVVLNQRESA